VKLKRLIVQGFKSFKDRTTIHFDEGITGIVGPNGCGKSNIVDALFWVMGEQSAKHLRGNSMKDVIFAGSSKYSPGAFAEASLILENEEGKHIHIGNKVSSPLEIQLTRKLYRNGETEYRINNNPCRLRDVQEVFMDTGAGAKSYSIIAQGEINRLVQAKPVERRVMIEEVAGITKFKARKKESLKKIELTQDNLNRLNDLQSEIEKNLRSLQSQAEKAEKARNLKEKIKRNDLVVQSHKEYELLKNYKNDKNSLVEKKLEIEGWSTKKNTLEVDLQQERIKRDEQTEKIERYQSEFNEISRALAAAEERFNFLCQSLTEKEKLLDSRKLELAEISTELNEKTEKLSSLNIIRESLETQQLEGFDYSDFTEKYELLKFDLESKEDSLSEIKSQISEKSKELNEIDQEIFKNSSKFEEYSNNLQDLTQEIESIEEQYSGFSGEMANDRDKVNALEKETKNLEEQFSKLKEETLDLDELDKNLGSEIAEKSKQLIIRESKLNSLKEIKDSLEGVKEGNSKFLNTDHAEGFKIIGSLMRSENKYAKGLETLFSDIIDALITNNASLSSLTSWFADNKEDTVDLVLTNSSNGEASIETIERLKLKGMTGIIPVVDIIQTEPAFQQQIEQLLQGYYFVENLDIAEVDLPGFSDLNFKGITDINGMHVLKKVGSGLVVQLKGSRADGTGMVVRNNKIIELENELIPLEKSLKELESQRDDIKCSLNEKRQSCEKMSTQLHETRTLFVTKKSTFDSRLENFESGNSRLDILKNRKNQISSARFEIQEDEEKLKDQHQTLVAVINESKEVYDVQNDEWLLLKDECDSSKEELIQKQIDAKTFEEKFKNNNGQIADSEEQLARLKNRSTTSQELIAKYNEEILTINSEIENLEKSNHESANTLTEKDQALALKKDGLGKLLSLMQERENEVKELSQRINKNEKNSIELNIKLGRYIVEEEQIVRNIFEKYHINLRKNLGNFLEYTEDEFVELNDIANLFVMQTESGPEEIAEQPFEFVRRYGQDLKDCEIKFRQYKQELGRLGEINWQAVEEYERQKLRNDFLKQQEIELKQSLADLETAISHIDEKSKIRFKTAFHEVSSRFQKVFPIIFGGGNALLKITGDINDAECGVDIIAQPPGKKMQNINLMSGGEKALTAVSLIFSIFLVKPSPFCLLDEVDAPLDDANVGRFNELLREMSHESQFILITHNKKTMELNDTLYGVTMQEPGVSKAISVQLH